MENKWFNRWNRKWLFVPVILWMGMIFYLSSMDGNASSDMSSPLAEKMLWVVHRIFTTMSEKDSIFLAGIMETVIRKCAHMSEYAILYLLLFIAFTGSISKKSKVILWSLVICVAYAATDEVHQLFVTGRSGRVLDVVIDSCGAGIMATFLQGIKTIRLKKQ